MTLVVSVKELETITNSELEKLVDKYIELCIPEKLLVDVIAKSIIIYPDPNKQRDYAKEHKLRFEIRLKIRHIIKTRALRKLVKAQQI